MQKVLLALVAIVGIGTFSAPAVMAGPADGAAISKLRNSSDLTIEVREGCGAGRHKDSAGVCVRGCGEGWYYSHRSRHCVRGPRLVPQNG